jgi:hypothetical protein
MRTGRISEAMMNRFPAISKKAWSNLAAVGAASFHAATEPG